MGGTKKKKKKKKREGGGGGGGGGEEGGRPNRAGGKKEKDGQKETKKQPPRGGPKEGRGGGRGRDTKKPLAGAAGRAGDPGTPPAEAGGGPDTLPSNPPPPPPPTVPGRAFLDSHTDRAVPLAELASHAKLSASHLQRSFKKLIGVSPKQYQDARRLTRFKSRLRAGDTVSRATYDAGFGSSSRVYEKSDTVLGMTPAAFRRGGAGVRIGYTIAEAPIGRVLVATTERGVCAVEIGATNADVERALKADFPNAIIERDDDAPRGFARCWTGFGIRPPRSRTAFPST